MAKRARAPILRYWPIDVTLCGAQFCARQNGGQIQMANFGTIGSRQNNAQHCFNAGYNAGWNDAQQQGGRSGNLQTAGQGTGGPNTGGPKKRAKRRTAAQMAAARAAAAKGKGGKNIAT